MTSDLDFRIASGAGAYRFPSEIGAGAWTTADPSTTPMSLRAMASVGMTLSYW
jgi:hypothetical protein